MRANIWVSALPPLYNALSMTGVLFILYLGGARVQSGAWDIAAFTTFIACFAKLSVKSSKAAKLFNAVQQAQVSWRRIKGFLCTPPEERDLPQKAPCSVKATGLSMPDVLEKREFRDRTRTDNRNNGTGSVRKKHARKGVFVRKSV